MEKPALNESMMDLILSSENMQKAWKQVKSNKGSPGIDGITIENFPDYLRKRWDKVKQALQEGYYSLLRFSGWKSPRNPEENVCWESRPYWIGLSSKP